jgi:leucyl/phenylalanyl-tRNA---protein transferase
MASRFFPPADSANADGVVAVGGSLEPERLLDAYRHGIFPWPISPRSKAIPWFSPDPRGVLELDALHVSRRLVQTIRSGKFEITSDRDFDAVVAACGTAQWRRHATWITTEIGAAYRALNERGQAHSIEAWHDGQLAGGLYGVTVGGLFAGESMFYHVRDASKVVLARLVEHLRERGYRLFDIQMLTPHMARMGGVEIPRAEYLKRLAAAVELPVTFGKIAEASGGRGSC